MFRKHFTHLPSTHLWAKEHLQELLLLSPHEKNAPWGDLRTLVTCDAQGAGIGRRGTPWVAASGDLLATFVLATPTQWPPQHLVFLALALATATLDALRVLLGTRSAPIALKWPNDLMCKGRKLAGALVEPLLTKGVVLLSLGVNIADDPGARDRLERTFAHLGEFDRDITRDQVIETLVPKLRDRLMQLFKRGGGPLVETLCAGVAIGAPIALTLPAIPPREVVGRFCGIDDEGHLLVECAAGRRAFAAGQVIHVHFPDPSEYVGSPH